MRLSKTKGSGVMRRKTALKGERKRDDGAERNEENMDERGGDVDIRRQWKAAGDDKKLEPLDKGKEN